jgi:hypothetical protein
MKKGNYSQKPQVRACFMSLGKVLSYGAHQAVEFPPNGELESDSTLTNPSKCESGCQLEVHLLNAGNVACLPGVLANV